MRTIAFLLLVLISVSNGQEMSLSGTSGFGTGFLEGGYASKMDVYQGETISFYISTPANPFTLKIYRYGKSKELITEIPNLPGGLKETKVSDQAYRYGCRWPVTLHDFKIPDNWKAGAYLAEFPVNSDTTNPVLFFVKEKDPLKRSPVLVFVPTCTYQAYNMFGGKSSYPEFSTNKDFATKLTYDRPFNPNNHHGVNRASFFAYDAKLIKWLEDYGYGKDIDVISDIALHSDPAYVNTHRVLLLAGHSSYMTRAQRENIEAFIAKGGHFACLAGNVMWWQIRLEDDNRTFVCYKHYDDPNPDPRLRTMEWYRVQRENTVIGVSYQNSGQSNYYWRGQFPGCLNSYFGFGGYIVHNSQHWVYKNSGLTEGDTLGWRADSSIVGYESDAALFKWQNGIPIVTGGDLSPLNFRILGLSATSSTSRDAADTYATMGIFKYNRPGGGFVFNGATIRFVWGLHSRNSKVSIILKNVLDHFLADRFPPEFTSWSPYTVVNKTIMTMPMSFNYKTRDLQYGKNLNMRVTAEGYHNEKVNYCWAVNDTLVAGAQSNSFILSSIKYPFGKNKVTAFAYNDKDTVALNWKINSVYGNGLAISSVPDTVILIGKPYKYVLSHYSYQNNHVEYIPKYIPAWARFVPETRTIEGIPDRRTDSIRIAVKDNLGNTDEQSFKLSSIETTYVKRNSTEPHYYLQQNFPNPFNPATTIRYAIPMDTYVKINIFDNLGKLIRTIISENQKAGEYEVEFKADGLANGIYFYQLVTPDASVSKKMIYLK